MEDARRILAQRTGSASNVDALTVILIAAGAASALIVLHSVAVVKRDNTSMLDIYRDMLASSLDHRNAADEDESEDESSDDEQSSSLVMLPSVDDSLDLDSQSFQAGLSPDD
jgi:hypothetical protein